MRLGDAGGGSGGCGGRGGRGLKKRWSTGSELSGLVSPTGPKLQAPSGLRFDVVCRPPLPQLGPEGSVVSPIFVR